MRCWIESPSQKSTTQQCSLRAFKMLEGESRKGAKLREGGDCDMRPNRPRQETSPSTRNDTVAGHRCLQVQGQVRQDVHRSWHAAIEQLFVLPTKLCKFVSPLLAALPSAKAAEGMLLRWQSIIHAPMHCNVACPQELGRSCNDSTLATHSRPLCPAAANRSCWRYLLFPSVLQIVLSACRSLEPVR